MNWLEPFRGFLLDANSRGWPDFDNHSSFWVFQIAQKPWKEQEKVKRERNKNLNLDFGGRRCKWWKRKKLKEILLRRKWDLDKGWLSGRVKRQK